MVKAPEKNDKCSTLSDVSESSNDNHATLDAGNETLERKSLSVSGSLQDLQVARPIMSRIRSQVPGQVRHIALPFSHVKTSDDMVVDFDGPEDPYQPLNWRFSKKLVTTILYGFTAMGAPWASSIYSTGQTQISKEFHVSTEVSTLGTSLLLFGLGLGPLVWAPLSEAYGRKPAVLAPYFLAAVFSFATATAKDVQTIMITRFFTGFFGSAPVTNTGGVLAVFGGPVLGPIVGGAISESYLGWRWTGYTTGILMMVCLILDLVFIDETYPPILLTRKARRLRLETGNWALHARHEEWNASYSDFAKKYLIRPFQLLATPICFLVALYASFVYAILYLSLAAFPIIFQEIRGWNQVVGALPFISYFIGIMIGALVNLSNQKFYVKRMKENNNRPVPEARLPPMMLGSVCFAGGLFILGWTSPAPIHWIAPNIGAVLMGIGILTILQPALNYLIDTFHSTAASAVAASTFLRSILAGSFPLFTDAMFHNLGVPWAASVLGFISVALLPIPYLFYIYGKRLRARGKFSKDST
ncbi:Major facilitator superfamily domain general substrate transporter [Penicillium verhagenii]|nr:Major facilitator superfamily domain general substrate transporter [Penicillium verhagenii]